MNTNPAVLIKIDEKKFPGLECRVQRVTVQDEGELLLLLRNSGSSTLGIKYGSIIGEVTSLITSKCISTKLARTGRKKESESVKPEQKKQFDEKDAAVGEKKILTKSKIRSTEGKQIRTIY